MRENGRKNGEIESKSFRERERERERERGALVRDVSSTKLGRLIEKQKVQG
jgi:hypothetical protein